MKLATLALALAGGITFGAMVPGAASAAPFSPAVSAPVQAGSALPVENVAWVCQRNRCTWNPRFRGPVPNYARNWGPPRRANCYWERVRDRHGRLQWVEICRGRVR